VTDRGSPLASTYFAGLPSRFISSTIERRPRIAPFTVVLKKTDLVLPGRLPLALTRSYRSGDMQLGSFGIGGAQLRRLPRLSDRERHGAVGPSPHRSDPQRHPLMGHTKSVHEVPAEAMGYLPT